MLKRKMEQMELESIIKVRRLQVAISNGPSSEMHKFKQPAPRFAHCAFCSEKPALVNIETE